jgi:hypothetical protein
LVFPSKGYHDYHGQRINLARSYLRNIPYLHPILTASRLIVNDKECPSINRFIIWLDEHYSEVFTSSRLVSIHGNFHLDNILVDCAGPGDESAISFVDPRGDLLGYPHYDLAKVQITLEGYYDELHYKQFSLRSKSVGNSYSFTLEVQPTWHEHYSRCLRQARKWLNVFAEWEEVPAPKFSRIVYVVECIHILSFCFYHAYAPDAYPDRVRAYVAILAIMMDRLMNTRGRDSLNSLPERRLSLV